MKRVQSVLLLAAFVISVLSIGCAGVKPLEKGQTVRCPSCGADMTIEEGLKEVEKAR